MFKMLEKKINCQNAYNEQINKDYCYQSHDIIHIGSAICSAYPNVIFAPPNEVDDAVSEKSQDYLSQFRAALTDNKKVAGIFKTNDTHWIAYALKIKSGNVICFYKDSYNTQRANFLKVVLSAFPNSFSYQLDQESVPEQKDSSSSGIFALYNMEVLAKSPNLCKKTLFKFFNPNPLELSFYRGTVFAKKYIEGCLYKAMQEIFILKICDDCSSEAMLLKRIIEEETPYKIKEIQVKEKNIINDSCCYGLLVEDKDKKGVCDYLKQFVQSEVAFNETDGDILLIIPNDLNLNNVKLHALYSAKQLNDKSSNLEISDLNRVLIETTSTVIFPNWNQKKNFINIIKTINFNIIIAKRQFSISFDVLKDKQIKHAFAISHLKYNINDDSSSTKSFNGGVKENILTQLALKNNAISSGSNSIITQETIDFKISVHSQELSEHKKKIPVSFLNSFLWEKNKYVKWDRISLSSINVSYKEGQFYPTDLVHGLLAEHCSSETGINAGHSKVQPGNNVVIANERASDFIKLGDINQYLKSWKVLGIIDDKHTGYLGIIYANDEARQLVLAHRSTNFELSLNTKNLQKESGLQQDIAGIFMGEILLHQAYGYVATDAAIQLLKNHSKYTDYSFSITGHSLGAWLAEMSAYYCSRDLEYPNVKTVSFDGPGSREMMKKLSENETKPFEYRKLNIVSYFSAPNLVNCINKHCGKIFTTYPNITNDFPEVLTNFNSQKKGDALLANYGHDLKNILSHFDPKNGMLYYDKPETCGIVNSWPSITHKHFGNTSHEHLFKDILEKFLKYVGIEKQIVKLVFKVYDVLEKTNEKFTTLESIVHLFLDICNKKIDHKQFWSAHKYLDKNSNYKDSVTDSLHQFQLHYVAGYRVSQISRKVRKIDDIEEDIVKYLICLKTNNEYMQGLQNDLADKVSKLKSKYEYIEVLKEIHTTEYSMSIDDLINEAQTLIYRLNLKWYLQENRYKKEQLYSNISSEPDIDITSRLNDVEDILHRKSIVIVKGMPGSGKTNLAKKYALINQNNITSIILDVSCDASFTNLLEFQTKVWNKEGKAFEFKKHSYENYTEALGMFSRVLEQNLQRALFILDNAANWNNVLQIKKRFEPLEIIGRIKYIITTRNDLFQGTEDITYVTLIPKSVSQIILPIDIELLKLLALLKPIVKAKYSTSISDKLKILCENSYAFVKRNGDIQLNTKVQKKAKESKMHSSALDFLILASEFHPNIIDKNYIISQFETFELNEFYADIKNMLENKNQTVQHPYCLRALITSLSPSIVCSNKHVKLFLDFLLKKEYRQLGKKITKLNKGFDMNITAENKTKYISNISNEIPDLVENIHYFIKEQTSFVLKSNTAKNYIFFGPSGSGKSTIINSLLGNSLKCICTGDEGQPAEIIVENTENCPVISFKSTTSQTFNVEGWIRENATYFDCPGLQDSRGLLFDMHNAQRLRLLSDVAQKGIGIIIVFSAVLINGRGKNFTDFLYQLDGIFDVESVKKNVLLVITQTNNPNVENYVQTLKDHYKELKKQGVVSGFLNLFLDQDFKSRIIFVRKVNYSGIEVKPSHFEDVHVALNKLELGSCTLNTNSISQSYMDELSKLSDVLNEYVKYKMIPLAQQIIKSLQKEIETSDKMGKDLKMFIRDKTFFIETDNKDQLIQQIEKLLPHQSKEIKKVSKTLEFLRLFNSSVKAHVSEWGAELRTLSRNYRIFTESVVTQFLEDQLVVTGLIVSVSEIDDVISKMSNIPKFIWIEAKMFLVDKSVVWRWKSQHSVVKKVENGINLYVKAKKCRVLDNNQTIDISGKNGVSPGDNGGNGGNFYGQFDYFFSGQLILDLRGGNGADGEFDTANRLKTITSSIEELKKKKEYINTVDNICEQKQSCDILKELDQFKIDLKVSREKLEKQVLEIEKIEKQLKIHRGKNRSIKYNNAQENKKSLENEKHFLEQNVSEMEQKVKDYENVAALKFLNDIRNKKLDILNKIDSNKKSLDKLIKDEDEIDKTLKNKNFITRTQKKVEELKIEYEDAKGNFIQLKVISSSLENILTDLNFVINTLPTEIVDTKSMSESNKNKQMLQENIEKLQKELNIQTKKCQSEKMTFYIAGES
ncbi:uncharacterized protein LOC136081605 [Hydra vulgaris]|uniref:Uncharacterized protein LOC136081605 n=1 Tax=Hydra vulgaris TaxID=6087 RepID=A0ABM4C0Q1_HYDVU